MIVLKAFWLWVFQLTSASFPSRQWTTNAEFFEEFREYEEFLTYYDDLINQYPGLLSKNVIGNSYEGREIVSLRLTTGGTSKPVVYIEATTHAREWLAPTTPLWILTTLLERYTAGDATATELVESLEWHIVGFLNPDGYTYSWSNDRLWRKNRRRNTGSNFYGVDLNRNWGPNNTWGTAGSSNNPSSDTYCGTGPFSEPESLATSKAETALAGRIAGLLAFHCYGPLLLRPYQYTYNEPPEPYNTEVANLGADMEDAINAVHNARYESIQGSDLYPHSGGTIDWTYLQFGIPAYTIELRGNSFIVPAGDIVLAGEENYEGVVVFAKHVLAKAAVSK